MSLLSKSHIYIFLCLYQILHIEKRGSSLQAMWETPAHQGSCPWPLQTAFPFSGHTVYSPVSSPCRLILLPGFPRPQGLLPQMDFKSHKLWDSSVHIFLFSQSLAEHLRNSIKTHWRLKNKSMGTRTTKINLPKAALLGWHWVPALCKMLTAPNADWAIRSQAGSHVWYLTIPTVKHPSPAVACITSTCVNTVRLVEGAALTTAESLGHLQRPGCRQPVQNTSQGQGTSPPSGTKWVKKTVTAPWHF